MDWKKQLKQMKLGYLQQRAPGFFELSGDDKMSTTPYDDRTSNGLTKCIYAIISNSTAATRKE
jgi:hypothetical protein